MSEMERRSYKVELRADSKNGMPTMIGRAACFNTLSTVMKTDDGMFFQEKIIPGAFAECMNDDVRALFNHDPNLILARTTSKTLRIAETEGGLDFELDPPDTTYARNLQVSMSRGDIDQCSFGFAVAAGGDKWFRDDVSGMIIREIRKIAKLFDVSPVTYPAYVNTNCATRSVKEFIELEEQEKRKLEEASKPKFDEIEHRQRVLKLNSLM